MYISLHLCTFRQNPEAASPRPRLPAPGAFPLRASMDGRTDGLISAYTTSASASTSHRSRPPSNPLLLPRVALLLLPLLSSSSLPNPRPVQASFRAGLGVGGKASKQSKAKQDPLPLHLPTAAKWPPPPTCLLLSFPGQKGLRTLFPSPLTERGREPAKKVFLVYTGRGRSRKKNEGVKGGSGHGGERDDDDFKMMASSETAERAEGGRRLVSRLFLLKSFCSTSASKLYVVRVLSPFATEDRGLLRVWRAIIFLARKSHSPHFLHNLIDPACSRKVFHSGSPL